MQPTSLLANNHANKSGLKAAHADKIVEALEKYGKPATAWRISLLPNIGMDYHAVARRLSELRDRGITINGTTSLTQDKMFEYAIRKDNTTNTWDRDI